MLVVLEVRGPVEWDDPTWQKFRSPRPCPSSSADELDTLRPVISVRFLPSTHPFSKYRVLSVSLQALC